MADDAVFDAGWLALREPADHRSRAPGPETRIAAEGAARGWTRVVDLGGGTGSNVRHLAPRLPWARHWTVVDHDPALLARVRAPAGATLRTVEGDLAAAGLAEVDDADLVTASALLDLVSEAWLRTWVARCVTRDRGVLVALTVDGGVSWGPGPDPYDDTVRALLNRHQTREKGLGAALGPRAARTARDLFREAGWRATLHPSPWRLSGPGDAPLAAALAEGWAEAAAEEDPGAAERIGAWIGRRRAVLARGRYRLRVGHLDLLALPPEVP